MNYEALRYQLVELFYDQERGAITFNEYIDTICSMMGVNSE